MPWAPDYVTTEEIRAYREIDDVGDDVALARAVTAASRSIDRFCGRQFGSVSSAEPRRFTARFSREYGRWVIPIDDLMDLTGFVCEIDTAGDLTFGSTLPVGEIDPWPVNAASDGMPWVRLVVVQSPTVLPVSADNAVRVTALWGWGSVPETVKEATLVQASRLLSRRRSQFGEIGAADPSPVVPAAWTTQRRGPGVSVDPEVRVMLGRYRRNWGMVS